MLQSPSLIDSSFIHFLIFFLHKLKDPVTFKTPLNYSKIYNMHPSQMQDHICESGSSILNGVNLEKSKKFVIVRI